MDFRAALLDQTRAFGELIATGDPETRIPTCPDWTLKQLFRHVGRGNRWAAQIIAERRTRALDPREVRDGRPPDDTDAAIAWLNDGAELVLDAADHVGNSARVWTFMGPKPVGWWIRRRVHEVAVHRADAALALGADFDLAPELAADAVSEWLDRTCVEATVAHQTPLEPGRTVHLHATDAGLGPTGEWMVRNDDGEIWWSHDHGKGSVGVRGSATNLLLAVTRRATAADLGLETFGDIGVWDRWLEHTPF
ncbi:maleylpyruvate isomerase family mycothiol-dependent enzyme [Mycobacterium sp. 155]|uniref:maleylpyruvate isomerase family mycothiol-dependent enzyme n=1 Tax=Mycobacterium sp. 155 TaxID=1157943 RepID=UPI00036887F2|nr:maleylpyruvate isomerase family mycothiol-dependent enzyme [Mycobacterium sp. 155]